MDTVKNYATTSMHVISTYLLNPVDCSELGQERSLEPGDSMGHLKIKDLPELPVYPGAGGGGAVYPGAGGRRPQNTGYM